MTILIPSNAPEPVDAGEPAADAIDKAVDIVPTTRPAMPIFLIASAKPVQMLARVEAAMSGPG
jgi:hypothetical protein